MPLDPNEKNEVPPTRTNASSDAFEADEVPAHADAAALSTGTSDSLGVLPPASPVLELTAAELADPEESGDAPVQGTVPTPAEGPDREAPDHEASDEATREAVASDKVTPSEATPDLEASGQVAPDEVVAAGFVTRRPRLVLWTFLAYVLLWLAFLALLVYYLTGMPQETITLDAPYYGAGLWVAVGLLALGVVLIPIVWLVARAKTSERSGLLAWVVFQGAVAVSVGALLWWAALAAVDYVRLGRVY